MKLQKDRQLGIIGLAIAIFIAVSTASLAKSNYIGDPGPKLFPYISSILMAICSISLIVKPGKSNGGLFTKSEAKSAALLFAVYVGSALCFWLLGFYVSVPIILFVISLMFSYVSHPEHAMKTRIIRSIIYAVVVGAAVIFLYVFLLEASRPKGLIWTLIRGY